MLPQVAVPAGGVVDFVVAVATILVVPLLVLAAGKAFDAVMRAWDPHVDPEQRVDWPEE